MQSKSTAWLMTLVLVLGSLFFIFFAEQRLSAEVSFHDHSGLVKSALATPRKIAKKSASETTTVVETQVPTTVTTSASVPIGGNNAETVSGQHLRATNALLVSKHKNVPVHTTVGRGKDYAVPIGRQLQLSPNPSFGILTSPSTGLLSSNCDSLFGLGALEEWTKNSGAQVKSNSGELILKCHERRPPGVNPNSLPHLFCEAKNIILSPNGATPASCPKYRPGYKCGNSTYFRYSSGFLEPAESCTHDFRKEQFPADHLRDIFMDGFTCNSNDLDELESVKIIDGYTFLVTREIGEHVNLFHAMTDHQNIHAAMVQQKVGPPNSTVLLLDNHEPGPFDSLFDVWSKNHPVMRLANQNEKLLIRNAIFVPPGYEALLYAKLELDDVGCSSPPGGLPMVNSFSAAILSHFGIQRRRRPRSIAMGPRKVVFEVRRPYELPGVSHPYVERQIANADELLAKLKQLPNVSVSMVQFASKSMVEQMQLVADADLFIGMHGAGMTHQLWLPIGGAHLELAPKKSLAWKSYGHLAPWIGVHYSLILNRHFPSNVERRSDGDHTTVDINEVYNQADLLLKKVEYSATGA